MKPLNGLTGLRPHGVRDRKCCDGGGRRQEVDRGLPTPGCPVRRFPNGRRRCEPQTLQHCGSAHVQLLALNDGPNPVPRNRLELFGLRDAQRLLFGALDDPLGDRVFRVAFDRRRKS